MSNGDSEQTDTTGISDEQLPEDLQPSEDNPLAEGLEPGEGAGDLLEEGKGAEEAEDAQTESEQDDTPESEG